MSKSIVAAVLAVAAALVASSAAEARGGHHHHHHFRGAYFYGAPIIVTRAPDCGYAYARWQGSGSYYWKQRYFACKGW